MKIWCNDAAALVTISSEDDTCPFCGHVVLPNVLIVPPGDEAEAHAEQERQRIADWLGRQRGTDIETLSAQLRRGDL